MTDHLYTAQLRVTRKETPRLCNLQLAAQITSTPMEVIIRQFEKRGYFENDKFVIHEVRYL